MPRVSVVTTCAQKPVKPQVGCGNSECNNSDSLKDRGTSRSRLCLPRVSVANNLAFTACSAACGATTATAQKVVNTSRPTRVCPGYQLSRTWGQHFMQQVECNCNDSYSSSQRMKTLLSKVEHV
jgi:hypothetical protein